MFGKKRSKKKSAMPAKKQEKYISEAIKDLNREIRLLSKRKLVFEKELNANKAKITILQNKERKLKQAILKLVEKREIINQKRRSIFSKIKRLQNKMKQIDKLKNKIKSL